MKTKTIADMELFVAGLEVECSDCQKGTTVIKGVGETRCEVCQLTGKVPRFPTLRRECPCVWAGSSSKAWLSHRRAIHGDNLGVNPHPSQCECEGRGWTPIAAEEDLNTWLVAMPISIYHGGKQGYGAVYWLKRVVGKGEAPTPHEAVVKAAYEALK